MDGGKVLAQYKLDNGDDIKITANAVRTLISTSASVTDKEILAFVALCRAQRLNPFTREVYLIKYGKNPASMVVGKDVFTKRAQANPKFQGMQAGLTLLTSDNRLIRREGSMSMDGEVIVGAWCKVFVEGYREPMFDEVPRREYDTGRGSWAKMPGTMLRKVAIVHTLREAFPADFAGLYDSAELGVEPSDLPEQAVEQPEDVEVEPVQDMAGDAPMEAQEAAQDAPQADDAGMNLADVEFEF